MVQHCEVVVFKRSAVWQELTTPHYLLCRLAAAAYIHKMGRGNWIQIILWQHVRPSQRFLSQRTQHSGSTFLYTYELKTRLGEHCTALQSAHDRQLCDRSLWVHMYTRMWSHYVMFSDSRIVAKGAHVVIILFEFNFPDPSYVYMQQRLIDTRDNEA